jgi:hypothetical protein
MRLLNARTKKFEEFVDEIPDYAILSHTWGKNELTFKDIERDGYISSRKIDGCCEKALKHRVGYVWVDTCCIDKCSSAELSEAINSMWNWYGESRVCYAYLSDVPPGTDVYDKDSAFSRSRWFTRGWTLQELLSPKRVVFYDASWNLIGRKSTDSADEGFAILLDRVTGIPHRALNRPWNLKSFSIAQRMSWAAHRTTTRVEDVAYSLLGLFEINMPLLYGEGTRAFVRLQEELVKSSDDETIFSWGFHQDAMEVTSLFASLFASSPRYFADCGAMIPFTPTGLKPSHYTLTNKGLYIETSLCDLPISGGITLARMNVSHLHRKSAGDCLALVLERSRENDMILSRHSKTPPVFVPTRMFSMSTSNVYVSRISGHELDAISSGLCVRPPLSSSQETCGIQEFYPPSWRHVLNTNPGILNGETLIWCQRKNLESQNQSILFLIDAFEQPVAVWLHYKFFPMLIASDIVLFRQRVLRTKDVVLLPRELGCRAAFIKTGFFGKTLAEVIIQSNDILEDALDWQEVLDFGDTELRFEVDKERESNENIWTVNIEVKEKQKQAQKSTTPSDPAFRAF